jgi:hypothetical protein
VRFLPLDRVFTDLGFFLAQRVNQVKFTDRTFNCDRQRAVQIWQYLIQHDNGHTNFHFEVSADFLDDAACMVLQKAPDGLFQLEIGVQSTHRPTLEAIRRNTQTETALANIARLKDAPHVHIHLDLIAGLPKESFNAFRTSFNAVYALRPHMLQLGFLKLLKGACLRDESDKHGIIYHETPPYEVLCTNHITYNELKTLKNIEHALDILYNSGHFVKTAAYVELFFASPFDFYRAFAEYWTQHGYHRVSQSYPRLYEIVYDFAMKNGTTQTILKNVLKFDWYMSGNQKSHPEWLNDNTSDIFNRTHKYGSNPVTGRRIPVAGFDFDPIVPINNINGNGTSPVLLQFIYNGKTRPGAQGKKVQAAIVTNSTA